MYDPSYIATDQVDLVQDTEYELLLYWNDYSQEGYYKLFWEYDSNPKEEVHLVPNWRNYEIDLMGNSIFIVPVVTPS